MKFFVLTLLFATLFVLGYAQNVQKFPFGSGGLGGGRPTGNELVGTWRSFGQNFGLKAGFRRNRLPNCFTASGLLGFTARVGSAAGQVGLGVSPRDNKARFLVFNSTQVKAKGFQVSYSFSSGENRTGSTCPSTNLLQGAVLQQISFSTDQVNWGPWTPSFEAVGWGDPRLAYNNAWRRGPSRRTFYWKGLSIARFARFRFVTVPASGVNWDTNVYSISNVRWRTFQDPPPCPHGLCSTGAPLATTCFSGCAGAVCEVQPSCCTTEWTSTCVGLAYSECGQLCD